MRKLFIAPFFLLISIPAFTDTFAGYREVVKTREIPDMAAYSLTNTNYSEAGFDIETAFANPFEFKAEGFYIQTSQGQAGTLDTKLTGALTPITVSVSLDYTYTLPIPLFQLDSGILVGTGWPLPGYGNGIGMQSNFYDPSISNNVYSQEVLSKQYLRFYGGAALQFDLASIFPGEWNHIQLRTYHELYYQYFLGATSDDEVFEYENVEDKMKNTRYYGNIYAGYKMPFFLRRVGLLYEVDIDIYHYSDSTIASSGWGSDFVNQAAGFIQTFSFDDRDEKTLDFMIQWGNYIVYRNGYGDDLTLWDREVDPNYYQFWRLRRVYICYTMKF